jgi:hypothetical protein
MGENKMKRIKSFIAIGAFALAVLALPSAASAQWGGRNDDYYGNSRLNNIRGTVMSLQNRARNPDRQISGIDNRRDRRDDRYGGYSRNDRFDNLDRLSNQFKNAAENLADTFGRGRNMGNSRDEAQRVLAIGSQLDRELSSTRSGRNNNRAYLMSEWRQIERDLQTIARAYGLNYRGSNNRLPFPLPF